MNSICRWCDAKFKPKRKRGRRPMCCSPECHEAFDADYNAKYCSTPEWKVKRKIKRDEKKLTVEA